VGLSVLLPVAKIAGGVVTAMLLIFGKRLALWSGGLLRLRVVEVVAQQEEKYPKN